MDDTTFLQNYRFKNKPFLHQKAYLQRFWRADIAALFADMGTGKSYMLINNIAMLYDKGGINAALIVAPKGVYRNWTSTEIPKHMPDHILYRLAVWTPSPRKAEKASLDNMFAITEDLKILVMNIEALSTKKGTSFAQRFLNAHTAMMAIDESTTIKNHSALRSKNAVTVGVKAKFRRILTGSPVTRSPMDLFQQCAFLSYGCLNQASFYGFQNRYAVVIERRLASHSFKQVVGYQRLDELSSKLNAFSFRIRKDECLDLPEKIYVKREVDLTDEQRRAYNQMRAMALVQFKEGMTTTVNALTQIMRLHQIVCGHIKLDDGTVKELPNLRIQEMLDTVEESEGKVIIWATYRHDIETIRLTLQKIYGMNSVASYYGDTTDDERQGVITRFQDPKSDLRFFVGNPRTGGYGITLTEAKLVIYYSNSFDLEVRLQSEDRAHRIGQKNNVTYVDLLCPGTVDEKIVQALRDKIDIAGRVLREDVKTWLI
jgi:SNF2 family DNA or RNA helicase